jgi:hypothetical protein
MSPTGFAIVTPLLASDAKKEYFLFASAALPRQQPRRNGNGRQAKAAAEMLACGSYE